MATATKTNMFAARGSQTARFIETHTLVFAADATVEVSTALHRIESFSFGQTGGSGSAILRINETVTSNLIVVPDSGQITVEAEAPGSSTYVLTLIGY